MILVTGASGFLGQHLVALLSANGKQVRALYYAHPPGPKARSLPGVIWQRCDLLDVFEVEEVMRNVDEVYHCAAVVSFHSGMKEKLLHFNIEGTAHIVNAALTEGVRKLGFVSSVAALSKNKVQGDKISEDAVLEEGGNNSVYAISKLQSEMEVWRGFAEGLDMVTVNPGIILGAPFEPSYGEGKDFWDEGSARLMKVVDSNFPFYTEGVNSWVDVRDVALLLYTLMESNISGERFIVSAGNYPYREIFTSMAIHLNRKPPHIKAGKILTEMVWRWNVLRSVVFGRQVTVTRETARTAQRKSYFSTEKIQAALPQFQFKEVDETIAWMAESYRNRAMKKK